jgi:hypothetical protein
MLNKFFGTYFQVHAALTLFKLLIIVVPVSDHDGTSDSDTPVAAAADFKSRLRSAGGVSFKFVSQ